MNRSIPAWQTAGFLFTSVFGTFLHFLFELTGGSLPAALVSAVNESIWEHMKLIYVPMLVFSFAEYFTFGKKLSCFWCVKLAGLATALLLIPILYYTYTGALGIHASWFNITIFFLAAGAAFYLETRLFQKNCSSPLPGWLCLILFLLPGGLFLLFTFLPPRIPLFRDPLTQSYGFR